MTTTDADRARAFLSPLFLVVAAVLLVAALGLRPTIGALTRHYSKEPIALRKSLDDFDGNKLTSFRPATDFISLAIGEGDVETEDVISPVMEPIGDLARAGVEDQCMLFVTYYSDPRSQIPHTPEVCYRQSGAVVNSMKSVAVATPGLAPETPEVEALLLDIDNHGHRTVVAYVIVSNGGFYHDRETVRFAIGWPGDKYTYFSKVEAVTKCPKGTPFEEAVERVTRLLSESLTVLIEEHFPTREDVRRE